MVSKHPMSSIDDLDAPLGNILKRLEGADTDEKLDDTREVVAGFLDMLMDSSLSHHPQFAPIKAMLEEEYRPWREKNKDTKAKRAKLTKKTKKKKRKS